MDVRQLVRDVKKFERRQVWYFENKKKNKKLAERGFQVLTKHNFLMEKMLLMSGEATIRKGFATTNPADVQRRQLRSKHQKIHKMVFGDR